MPSPAEVAYQEAHINDTRVPDMLAAFIFSLAIAYVSVGLRYVSRRVKQQQWLMDDWVILGSLVCFATFRDRRERGCHALAHMFLFLIRVDFTYWPLME